MLGLDKIEWRISLLGAAIASLVAIDTGIKWSRNTPITNKVSPSQSKACPSLYHYVTKSKICEEIVKNTRSEWELQFFFVLVVALCLVYFSLRRKRAGVACFAIFLGLFLGIESGLLFFALGLWLIVRAYRLQKYGVPSMLGSNRVARDMATARKEGRVFTPDGSVPSVAASPKSTPSKPATPEASKRYTPKKPPRRRRS